jgi:predicted dehydrogenase
VNPKISGGGYFYDLASHQFDFFDFLFGRIMKASGLAKTLRDYTPPEDATRPGDVWVEVSWGMGSWSVSKISD